MSELPKDSRDKVIPFTLFNELLRVVLGQGKLEGLDKTDIPNLLRLGTAAGRTGSRADLLALSRQLTIPEITRSRIPKELTPRRAEELLAVARWIMPALSLGGRKPVIYNFVIVVPPGHGGTYFFQALYDILSELAPSDTVSILAPEFGHLDNIAQRTGNLVMLDGVDSIRGGKSISTALSSVLVITEDQREKAEGMLLGTTYYYDLEPLEKADVVNIAISNQIYHPDIDPDITEAVGFMLDSAITPKEILTSIEITRRSGDRYRPGDGEKPLDLEVFYMTAEKLGASRKVPVPLHKLESSLVEKVYGQEDTIRQVSRHLGKGFYNLQKSNRPLLVGFFFGPSGTGKTELAKQLSDVYYGPGHMVRLDMSEFSEEHSAAGLFGPPPGYIGYGNDSKFVAELRKHQQCLILFDEIEKASRKVYHALLQMMDQGRFTTTRGETFDLTSDIIIMTSNAKSKEVTNSKLGFHQGNEGQYSVSEMRNLLAKEFPPEFVNRIDIIAQFKPLLTTAAKRILVRELELTRTNLQAKSVKFIYDDALIEELLQNYDKNGGGRDLVRRVEVVQSNAVADLMEKRNAKEVKGRYQTEVPRTKRTKAR